MRNFLKNLFTPRSKYKSHSEAMIVTCFYNPANSPYRLKAFREYYKTIKHLNHFIVECVIKGGKSQISDVSHLTIETEKLLWHKEALLNAAIKDIPKEFNYIFWIDADVIFTNKNWMVEAVNKMKAGAKVVQLFEYCIHLEKDEMQPSFNVEYARLYCSIPSRRHKRMWRGFAANYAQKKIEFTSANYDVHGHVGFAWGATRDVLAAVPLFDKVLIGGADHIIAHAAAGQIPHNCIKRHFVEMLDEVVQWSEQFNKVVKGRLGYVAGDVYHIWHGDIEKREYSKRIRDFEPKMKNITEKDENGLYKHDDAATDAFMNEYYKRREVTQSGILNPLDILNPFNPMNQILESVDSPSQQAEQEFDGFGGGSFGGAGAGAKWDLEPSVQEPGTQQTDGYSLGDEQAIQPQDFQPLEGGDIQGAMDSDQYGSTFS
jgi:hypothetical protein